MFGPTAGVTERATWGLDDATVVVQELGGGERTAQDAVTRGLSGGSVLGAQASHERTGLNPTNGQTFTGVTKKLRVRGRGGDQREPACFIPGHPCSRPLPSQLYARRYASRDHILDPRGWEADQAPRAVP